jgi:hypothetical protein
LAGARSQVGQDFFDPVESGCYPRQRHRIAGDQGWLSLRVSVAVEQPGGQPEAQYLLVLAEGAVPAP